MACRRSAPILLVVPLAFSVGACTGATGGGAPGPDDGGSPSSGGAPGTVGTGGAARGPGGTGGATGSGGGVVAPGSGGRAATGGGGATGGRANGGSATGGRGSSGGAGAGGRGTGGAIGGSTGMGGGNWLAGYTATMFGNTSAGDCSGVANFTDATNISGATCTHQGVTITPYAAGTANNSSYYAAPGDLSSIWMGPTCVCPTGSTTNAAGLCSRAPSCPMEAVCGRCFEVKCDPMGSGMYSDGATRVGPMYCNPNQTAVVQIIDACPHNHPSNIWWCSQRANHIDLSCSAMKAVAGNPNNVGSWGWLNVQVRPVDCAVGLGVHAQ